MKQKSNISFNSHDYDYFETLDKDGWRWEFTRRNVNYEKACEELASLLKVNERCQSLACEGCTYGKGKKLEKYVPCAFDIVTYIFCKFEIRPRQRYDIFFPESSLRYPDIPDSLKPVTSPIDSSKTLTSIRGLQLINHVVRKVGHQAITLDADQIVDLIADILSPRYLTGKEGRTLFVGLDLDSTREDLRQAFEALLQKWVRPKTSKKDKKIHPLKWISELMIWDIRKAHRFSLKEAGYNVGIAAEDTAKKQYYTAYKLIFGEKYDPNNFKRPEIKKEYLNNFCDMCSKKVICNSLCPDVMGFVNQDTKKYQREQTYGNIEEHETVVRGQSNTRDLHNYLWYPPES